MEDLNVPQVIGKRILNLLSYLKKMRCQHDQQFSSLCDRVARGRITEADEVYLQSRV